MSILEEIAHVRGVYREQTGEAPTTLHLGTRQWKRLQQDVLPLAPVEIEWHGGRYYVLGMAVKRDAVNDLLEVGIS